ncbi:exocyst complex component EXO70B1-like [Panicum miliaceum]|uniref:Exocyst subunit Exo70 family protein n=1 Tax=Panicum miliaceum TaxID=4540 RepID=A0A3L6QSL8_PANMI|nr:exocyst complex component EXO70B1-like [Panicum miliaceum]
MASPSPRRHALLPPPRHRRTLSSTLVQESVAAAAALVRKWHPDDAPASGSLFLLHAAEHEEAQRFLRAAADLHRAMLFFASDVTYGGDGLVQAQALLQTAMRRLDLELQQLLLDDITQSAADATRRSNIRAVAEAMMAAGYGKECISTFKSHRRAALAAELQRLLGFLSPPDHLHKLTWEQLDGSIIPSWLAAATVAFNSLFVAEKDLCDAVFAGGNAAVGEAVFAAVANDQATSLLAVAEAAVARARRAPERLFRVLDVHDTLTEVLPGLLSVFGDSSEVAARAALVVAKVGEAARGTLGSLEAAIQKEPSKATAAGGAVHPLTRYVMNYLVFLADYQEGLALVYDDHEQEASSSSSVITHRLVSVLLGKLEAKAGCYREVALSYLFLANNTQYVANKVVGSGKLRGILGDGWAEAQGAKARAHVGVYVRAAWGKVMAAISGAEPPEAVEQAVMEAVGMQEQWVAADEETGEALRTAAMAAVVPKYRMFYRRYGAAVRLTPGDVTTMIAALFAGGCNRKMMMSELDQWYSIS